MKRIDWNSCGLGAATLLLAHEIYYVADQANPPEERWAAVFFVVALAAACVWLWRRLETSSDVFSDRCAVCGFQHTLDELLSVCEHDLRRGFHRCAYCNEFFPVHALHRRHHSCRACEAEMLNEQPDGD